MQPDEKAAITLAVKDVRMPTIVELGARGGEDERDLRACFSESARYVMVEPDMRNCQIILDAPWGRGVFIHTNRRLVLGEVLAILTEPGASVQIRRVLFCISALMAAPMVAS